MHVVVTARWYPVAIARYILNALRRVDGIEITTLGVQTGTRIPWRGGMDLPISYVYDPDIPVRFDREFPMRAAEQIVGKPVDVWLQIDAGFHLTGRPRHGKNIIVGTDPHVLNYDKQRYYADIFYCMQTPYIKTGDYYLPYAYDRYWHLPLERSGIDQRFEYHVAMVGVMYKMRQQFLSRLGGYKTFGRCGAAYNDARAIYYRSLTSFNLSSREDLTARVFELAAMGVPFVANDVPDIKRIFGDAVVTFSGIDDGVGKLRTMIDSKQIRDDAAATAMKAVQPHTWDARVKQILNGDDYG